MGLLSQKWGPVGLIFHSFLNFAIYLFQRRSQDEKKGGGHEPKYYIQAKKKLFRGGTFYTLYCVSSDCLCRFQFILCYFVGRYFSAVSLPAPFYTAYCGTFENFKESRLEPPPFPSKIHKMYTFLDWNISFSFQNMASFIVSFIFFSKVETTIYLTIGILAILGFEYDTGRGGGLGNKYWVCLFSIIIDSFRHSFWWHYLVLCFILPVEFEETA